MKLFNTMSRQIEEVQPPAPAKLGLYSCGPTVYDYAHLGHLRKFTMDDLLVRTLRHQGYQVHFVQNITDVGHLASDADTGEDKMEKGAQKYQTTVWELAKKFEEHFWYSMQLMGNLKPDVSPRATEHIEEQLKLVQELEAKGFTYVIENDGVYFDTSRLEDYGQLARRGDLAQLQEGARVEPVAGKKHPTDFALWKFERPGESRAMVWPSPWHERSFPGWHVECSAMSMKYLGEQFDIHTGGIDHISVHHPNEIAQSEAATGKKPFVRYWVHHNFLMVEGEKMSKSKNNFFTIDDVMERGFHPLALRLLFLTAHYRSEMNFTWENLAGVHKSYLRLLETLSQFKRESGRTVLSEDKLEKIDRYRQQFFAELANDLNSPAAVAVMWEVVKSNIPGVDKHELLMDFDQVLGLGFSQADQILAKWGGTAVTAVELPTEVKQLVADRESARQEQNWELADQIRQQLLGHGFEVKDTPQGAELIKKSNF